MERTKVGTGDDNQLEALRSTLALMPTSGFRAWTRGLLEVLGYGSRRTQELSGSVDEFIRDFPSLNENTETERKFREQTQSVNLIFQLTSDEITASSQPTFQLDAASFDKGHEQSFIFFAVELNGKQFPRGQYAQFTREINKRLSQPTVVLFRTASDLLTLAFVHRRPHKRDSGRDVLGKVSLIREIDPANPHRAHLDILADLSLAECASWMDLNNKPHNFDGLLAAWLDKLDTEELNRQFYRELFDWFEWAVENVKFPSTVPAEQQIIRLITRILFVWFIKEKGLVREEWFVQAEMEKLLSDFGGSDYYRAVLQNLFFATLNTEMGARGFSTRREPSHRVFSRYRYKSLIDDVERFNELMKQTPFINGGLFDCLDDEESRSAGGKRIDMFSDPDPNDGPGAAEARREAWRELNVPDALFFDEGYGLFHLLNHYKFTVEENTPIEQEVALDPELLGKVFENLLAAYNPETRDTARRQTGSYYTPRAVVDYMVEEALVATLKQKCLPKTGNADDWDTSLHWLLDYADEFNDVDVLFDDPAKESIIRAIANLKLLDPAVGSGAFPMGMLHKLTLALRRLDPRNRRWETLQKERASAKADAAFESMDQQQRDAELLEISEIFQRYSGDFGRKLYLIQNSIFGVDIQPVACQIAKLRFFISLAIEQELDESEDNLGIKPLPNLETRFVTANTLLNLQAADQLDLFRQQIEALKTKLVENRERHFHATTRLKKLACRDEDNRLREALSKELKSAGLPKDDADKIALWDPYDQNGKSDWFDAGYMFGIANGFDVVIGNPPYIQLQKNGGELGKLYRDSGFSTFASTGDIYQLFYEKGVNLLIEEGHLCYITSNKWMRAGYGNKLREFFSEKVNAKTLLDFGGFRVFESATVDTNILLIGKAHPRQQLQATHFKSDFKTGDSIGRYANRNVVHLPRLGNDTWFIASKAEINLKEKIERIGKPLKEWDISINYGIKTGYNTAFIIDNHTKDALIAKDANSADLIKPMLRGRDIKRYKANWAGLWVIDSHNGYGNIPPVDIDAYPAVKIHLDKYYARLAKRRDRGITPYNLRNCAYHAVFSKEKIVYPETMRRAKHLDNGFPRFSLDLSGGYVTDKTAFILTGENLRYILALLNSKLMRFLIPLYVYSWDTNGFLMQKIFVERVPIPDISASQRRPLIHIVDRILQAKAINPDVNTNVAEAEIDQLIYPLYNLTDEEISLIES